MDSALGSAVEVVQARDVKSAREIISSIDVDLIITDLDMGGGVEDGFDLVRSIRASGVNAMVCVHSNRVVAADHIEASEVGANAFVPKPMSRGQALRILLQALDSRAVSG